MTDAELRDIELDLDDADWARAWPSVARTMRQLIAEVWRLKKLLDKQKVL